MLWVPTYLDKVEQRAKAHGCALVIDFNLTARGEKERKEGGRNGEEEGDGTKAEKERRAGGRV